jgi:hypothetical protein
MKNREDWQLRLSVLLVVYNHEKHLDQAMQGLLQQQFPGIIEVIVADDCSSDSSMQIIRRYAELSDRFRFVFLEPCNNLGITKNYERGFARCSGEYVAVLEGDDYWTSPVKLKRQVEFLDVHYECDLCSANYFVYEESRANFFTRVAPGFGHRLVTARELIADNLVGNFSTCLYRTAALLKLPPALFTLRSYDWIVNICVARTSLIGFLEEPLSVYRLHSNGVWSQTSQLQQLNAQLEVIPAYDQLTEQTFHTEFRALSDALKHRIALLEESHVIPLAVAEPAALELPPAEPPAAIAPVRRSRLSLVILISDCLPPVFFSVARLVVPPLLKRYLVKTLRRSTV